MSVQILIHVDMQTYANINIQLLHLSEGDMTISSRDQHCPVLFACLNKCFTSQSTAMVMSGHCLHFTGLLPNIRMS